MADTFDIFFTLLSIASGNAGADRLAGKPVDWQRMFALSDNHAMLGIVFSAIQRLPREMLPPRDIYMDWLGQAAVIQQRNQQVSKKAVELSQKMMKKGFPGVVLKGQGIAQLYPDPNLRSAGDIDFWVPMRSRRDIYDHVLKADPNAYVVYHHAEFHPFKSVEVELHFTPSWFYNIRHNRIFQQYCNAMAPQCLASECDTGMGKISVPTLEFNRVYILVHIYRHLFSEGIGLRQLMDYYAVLSAGRADGSDAACSNKASLDMISRLGMLKFCGAVMWVLQRVFGLDESLMLCPPRAREGEALLAEIMRSGNFGIVDSSVASRQSMSQLRKFFWSLRRSSRFAFTYPNEILWQPVWKIWHFFWRRNNNRGVNKTQNKKN